MDAAFKQELVAVIDERMDVRFQQYDEKMDARFQLMREENIAMIKTTVIAAVEEAMEKYMSENNNKTSTAGVIAAEEEKIVTLGIYDFIWPFRRFWIPVCPKSWVDIKPD